MKHIVDDKADIVNLNNEELYLAGRMYNLEPFAMEQFNGGEYLLLHSLLFYARTCKSITHRSHSLMDCCLRE